MPVRPALSADAGGIARVHVLSWQQAYQGLLPQALLDSQSVELRTRQWQQWLEQNTMPCLVACESDAIVGFASGGALRDLRGDYPGFDCEIAAIYLLPKAQGRGLGRSLFEAMRSQLQAQGFQRMLVWVLASNTPARNFYERLGGEALLQNLTILGAATEVPVEVDEVGYGWSLKQL